MLRVGSFNAQVRPATDADWKWIRATAVPQVRALLAKSRGEAWQLVGHQLCDALRPHLHIVVCEIVDAEPILLGWRATLDGELVYEYVARGYRGAGVARAMRSAEKARAA